MNTWWGVKFAAEASTVFKKRWEQVLKREFNMKKDRSAPNPTTEIILMGGGIRLFRAVQQSASGQPNTDEGKPSKKGKRNELGENVNPTSKKPRICPQNPEQVSEPESRSEGNTDSSALTSSRRVEIVIEDDENAAVTPSEASMQGEEKSISTEKKRGRVEDDDGLLDNTSSQDRKRIKVRHGRASLGIG